MKKDKLLVLGAGNSQLDLIRIGKEMGMEVFVLGGSLGEPGQDMGDHFAQVDIRDEEAVYQYAKDQEVDFIFTMGLEMALPIIANVSARLDLPRFFEPDLFDRLANKAVWRKMLEGVEGNLPSQPVDRVEDLADWDLYPAVIKPVDGSGQRGVHKVNSYAEVKKNFDHAQSFSKSGPVLIEQFAGGDEISVNAYFEEGKLAFAMPSDRYAFKDLPGGIINHHIIPSLYAGSGQAKDRVLTLVQKVGQRMGFENGHVYYQMKVKDGQPYLVEFTPRFDGCHMWNLIAHATGLDLRRVSLEWLAEGKSKSLDAYKSRPVQGVWRTQFLSLPSGSEFNRDAFDLPEDLEYLTWYYQDGDKVKSVTGYMEKCGYYIEHKDQAPDQAENR